MKNLRQGPRALVAGALLVAAVGTLAVGARSDDETTERMQTTRGTLEQWIETNRVLSREKTDWKLGKELLDGQVAVVRREIASLRDKITGATQSITEADSETGGVAEEHERLVAAAEVLDESIGVFELRTRELLARLPGPLQDRVKPLSQKLPEDPDNATQSLSDRYVAVVGILNEIDKFNLEVALFSEVITLSNDDLAEVSTMYMGIGQGYYVSADGKHAGVGFSTPDGWKWRAKDGAAPDIAKAIAIRRNEQMAEYVRLPVHLDVE